jgi:serine-type D-Ala-D-Ala carboxypeptidase (penicillin-binding protein 5/6)
VVGYDVLMKRFLPGTVIAVLFGLLFVDSAHAGSIRELGTITAKAAIVVDQATGDVLFARNPNLRLPPASTTKVVTAMVALRSGMVDDFVPVSAYAAHVEPSKIYLKPGWKMRVGDLVYAILLNSANDASVALAEGIAGSVPAFAELMNQTAREVGAYNSHFVNPNGLPAPGHYSTVRDLTTIFHHALAIPGVRTILSTQSTSIHPEGMTRNIALRSHNHLLSRRDIQAVGKTGWTREAKRCYVGAAASGDREILVAVLGSRNLWGDLDKLIQYGLTSPPASPVWSDADKWHQAATRSKVDDAKASLPKQHKVPNATNRLDTSGELTNARRGSGSTQQEHGFQYSVRLSSLGSRTAANKLRRSLVDQGYEASVQRSHTDGRNVYQITVSGFDSRVSARRAARKLQRTYRLEPLIIAARG